MISFQKIIAWFLIGLLCFEVTFRIPFIVPDASALESNNHEDIVSLLVEEELFRKISSDIDTYARRIQNKLPNTRTAILTYPRDTDPYLIAAANERLYFSGLPDHGNKTQKLVGTILIGHVPLPVVHKDNKDFLSLYPYTDFDEPHFFWNWETSRYEYLNQTKNDPRPDVWHSVIDPNTGNLENDVQKIREFFTRVYEFDDKKGRYQNVGENPQVLYMDSLNESRAASKGLLAVYEQIFIPQQEHILYHRFTREFSQYLYTGFLALMKSEGSEKLVSFREWVPDVNSSSSFLKNASDITTKVFGEELLTPFLKVINEKYLGDVNRWIHNTGRYYNGYSDVRVDTIPELITTKDALTGQILKEGNDALEKLIDTYVDNNLSLDIPILVSRPGQKTITENQTVAGKVKKVSRTYNFVYDNYFYGTKASDITSASQCSLIRGTSFGGKNTTVEMNHGYNTVAATDDSKRVATDTNAGIKCADMTQSYWGGNSSLNTTYKNGEITLQNHRYDDFSLPILDLSAGKKTTGTNGPLNCLRNDLILRPYQHSGLENRKYLWPTETGGSRYSCETPLQSPTPSPFGLDPTPETSENILSSLAGCTGTTGTITLLNRNGGSLGLCQANGLSGTYKRIPSLFKHSDPSSEVYGKQLQGNTTPNLPVDEERYLLYLDRTGAQARIDYPNLFDIKIDVNDSDEVIVDKIRKALDSAQSRLAPTVSLPSNHRWKQLIQSGTSAVNIADALLANTDIRAGILDALRWKQYDIEMKYSEVLKTALTPTIVNGKILLPDKKDLYEISYLGGQGDARNFVFGFSPEGKTDLPEWFTSIQETHNEETLSIAPLSVDSISEFSLSDSEIAQLLGEDTSSSETSGESGGSEGGEGEEASGEEESDTEIKESECGDPTGVVIWEWLSAIQCWLSNLMDTEWFTPPEIDDLDFPEPPSFTVSVGNDIVWTTKELENVEQIDSNDNDVIDYVEENISSLTLNNTLSATTIEPTQTLRIDTTLENGTKRINDDVTNIDLEILRIDDLDEKKSYSARDPEWQKIQNNYFSVSGGNTLRDGHAVWIFTSKNNHRTRITFESRIYSGENVLIRSEQSSVLIGPISLGVTVLSTSGSPTSETITAGSSAGINVLLSGMDTYPSAADVIIQDYVTGEQKGNYKSVPVSSGKFRLGSPIINPIIERAGRYTMTVVAGDYSGKTYFTIAPDKPHHIDIDLNNILIKDTPEQFSLALKDSWGNTINTQDWDLQMTSSSNILLSPLATKATSDIAGKFTSPLTITPLESGNTTLNFTAINGTEKILSTLSRPVLSEALIVLDIPNRSALEVGQEVPVNFSIQRQDGSIVEDWNMSVGIGIRGTDASLADKTITFAQGRASTTLKTGTRTGTVSIYLTDTGLGKIIGESFVIGSGVPARIALESSDILHAKVGARGIIRAYIYDQYENPTTLHGYTLKITPDKPTLLQAITGYREVGTGVLEADIISTGIPGRILFHSWLEKDGQKSSVSTLENVTKTNVFPVMTSEEVSQNSWQNITQVLLGAAFGQSPIQGYFAGSVLFSSSTKTLALSTLMDTPENPLLTLSPSGSIVTGSAQYGTGVEVQIESYNNGALSLIVYDARLGSIARVRYPVMSDDRGLTACKNPCDKDLLYFTPENTSITYKDGVVYKGAQRLFSVNEIFNFPGLSFSFLHQPSDELQFVVSYNGESLGTLSLKWKTRVPTERGTKDTSNTFTLESLFSNLSTKLVWSNKSSYETPGIVLYDADIDSSYVGGSHDYGWSAYPSKYGLGWTQDNTSLLQFAAGQGWANSMKNHGDYVTVNLGDPIITLPNYQVNTVTGLDQTVGEPIYVGTSDIDDFVFRDTNSDGKKDLIVYHPDGTIGMGLSRGDGVMIDVGDLLSVREAQQDMVRAGDFIGDGYADIVYVDDEGALHQVTHDTDGPIEKPMKYDQTPVLGQVEQIEVFDMDHDGIDDIIVLDHLGSLYIFYGHSSGTFRVQLIENVYDFILSDTAKTSYFTGAISYNGLGFVDPDSIKKSSNFELQSKQDQVNSILFTQIRLAKNSSGTGANAEAKSAGTSVVNSLDVDSDGFLRMYDGDATSLSNSLQFGYDAFEENAEGAVTVSAGTESYDTFDLLKAPFISQGYVSIKKQYRSLEESGQILAGSPIEVQISVKNVSNKNIGNILLLERFADYLDVSEMDYSLVRGDKKETRSFLEDSSQNNAGIADLRDVTLTPGTSLEIFYSGTLRSFTFGRFDVGYLEDANDPVGSGSIPADKVRTINETAIEKGAIPEEEFYNHDVYGDIRFNPNETCGGPLLLWRSHNTYDRTYSKTIISRQLQDPTKNATELGEDPTQILQDASATTTQANATIPTSTKQVAAETIQKQTSFPSGLSWDYRIGSVPSVGDRDVYMVDLFAVSAQKISEFKKAGKKVVCYVNAGALQSGPHGQGLSDADTVSGGAQFQEDWDEKFLNIRSPRVREVMKKRLDLAVTKGCQGIEPDNIDAYDNDTSLTQNDTIDYMKFLSQESHSRGLALGLKNASGIASRIEPMTDFAIVEQCHEYGECSSYSSFARSGKAVFVVEYNNSCANGPTGFSNITCDLDLNGQCENCGSSGAASSNEGDDGGDEGDDGGDEGDDGGDEGDDGGDEGDDGGDEGDDGGDEGDDEDALSEWQSDGDEDDIPDRGDDDHGEVFDVSTNGNTTQVGIGLGKIDEVVDDIIKGAQEIISSLSCGFGDPGCISMPINWAANMPGNTVTAMGYAIPGANQPPIACHKDVRCGIPVFAYPTLCPGTNTPTCTWPPDPIGAGGAFDYYGGTAVTGGNGLADGVNASGSVVGKNPGTFMPGYGISQYRLFIGATLTGAVAEVFCFGPNNHVNPTINFPGLFPITFQGNCIFATQPLTQCEDDGSEDEPLDEELDVADELSEEPGDDSSETPLDDNTDDNRFTNADECSYFEPIDSYPAEISQSANAYLSQPNDTTVSALQETISSNADVINDSGSTDSALGFSTTAPSSAYERLNGENNLEYEMQSGTGMLQIALDPSAMKFKDFGEVMDINLTSIKGFPNFVMDWYQRQMDEIMSSLTHLPDLKIFMPDLTGLADGGLIAGFGTGLKDAFNGTNQDPNAAANGLSPATGLSQNSPLGDLSQMSPDQRSAIQNNENMLKTKPEYGCLQCGEYANNYAEQLTGTRPMGETITDKQNAANPLAIPKAGDLAVHGSYNHASIIEEVLPGGIMKLRAADGTVKNSPNWNGQPKIYSSVGTKESLDIFGYVTMPQKSQVSGKSSSGSPSSTCTSGTCGTSNSSTSHSSGGSIANTAATTAGQSGFDKALSGISSGLGKLGTGVGNVLGGAETAANSASSFIQQKTSGIQNAFEYLGTLPIIDVHPETISFDIPWVGKQEAQAWIARNQAILDSWKNLPADAANSVGVGALIASIESNIETVRSYFELPEKLQTLYYLKEKLLYGILQNVKAIQELMGGWLYENGQRFKGWVEAFILITKLFDLWQVLIDVFNDYEVECGECRNERWNLLHWLWIIISAIIPPIPVIEMPRWPDIELDFSDIDLSLDIAYPVFDLNFYPVSLPDAPAPTISGFPLDPMPQLPQLPDLNVDFDIPVIQLPKLPDLPPPPKIPELSQALEIVLKIFKILTLIQCLYRKVPLSPEWYVGTKVAHKTERQGYLPFDFLDSRLPSVSMEWLEAIRVSSHVKLEYDVDFVIDVLKEALEPFTNFPKNISQLSGGGSGGGTVDFNINPESGVEVETSALSDAPEVSLAAIPDLLKSLFVATTDVEMVDPVVGLNYINTMVNTLDLNPIRKQQITAILERNTHADVDFSHVQKKVDHRFDQIAQAVHLDIEKNKIDTQDLVAWGEGKKKPEDIPFIASQIPNSPHLAQSAQSSSRLLALAPNILNPLIRSTLKQGISSIAPIVAPLAVAPIPETVVPPRTGNEYADMVDTLGIEKAQGLYVTNGNTTRRLIDYTEHLDGKTKIHTVDDDADGDLDVYYSLGSVIYRKENYSNNATYYTIKDAPQVYSVSDIYEDFFGIDSATLSKVPSEGQIDILQSHTAGRIYYQAFMKKENTHSRLRLFRSLFQTDDSKARYLVDMIPESDDNSSTLSVQNVPRILDIDGLVFIEHKKVYRKLITGQKFINEEGREEDLSSDFVIRGGQSGYTSESTTVDVTSGGKTVEQKMVAGQRLIFTGDSQVKIRKGSLILFGNTTEKRALSIRDTHMPLLPGDLIITDKNGGVTLKFPDATETTIGAGQYWTLTEYEPGIGIKKLTLPVEAEWYYGNIVDAESSHDDLRTPHATVFDAYTDFSESDIVSQIPREISLSLPGPTEVDFASYFPADTLINIEIFRLPSSEWRRISNTKVAFEAQKETREILVRVTTASRVRDYITSIVTKPPKLSIDTVDKEGTLSGKLTSATGVFPMGIQSYLDNQSWTLADGFENTGNTFATNIVRGATKFSVQQGTESLVTFDRSSALPVMSAGVTMSPNIVIGKTLGYSLYQGKNERIKTQYQGQNISYKQISTFEEITSSGIFVMGVGVRLEPATLLDKNLSGGVYITDTSYNPIIILDSAGVVRSLNSTVSWSASVVNSHVVFTLFKERQELGKIILAGDMLTHWSN